MSISFLKSDSIQPARANTGTHVGMPALGESRKKTAAFRVAIFTSGRRGQNISNEAKITANYIVNLTKSPPHVQLKKSIPVMRLAGNGNISKSSVMARLRPDAAPRDRTDPGRALRLAFARR